MEDNSDNIEEIEQEKSEINESSLWQKISKYFKNAGIKVIYIVLLLFYAFKRKDTPAWAKRIILGTLGYFIAPIDALPDLTPFIGYTDDLGILSIGLVAVAAYVNDEVKVKARGKLTDWFKTYDGKELEPVDKKL